MSTRILSALVVLAALPGAPLHAQADPDSVRLRNECRLARQVLTLGEPATHREEALSVIGICGPDAVPAMVQAWSPESTSGWSRGELEILVTSTRGLMTPELIEAVFSAVEDPARRAETRVASLLVLITWADPSTGPDFDDLLGEKATLEHHFYGHVSHPFTAVGRDRLPPITGRLRAVLEVLEASDPDAAVRTAARKALRNRPFR